MDYDKLEMLRSGMQMIIHAQNWSNIYTSYSSSLFVAWVFGIFSVHFCPFKKL